MWVIVLYDSISEKRDDTILDILGYENNVTNYKYLYKSPYSKSFSTTPNIGHALIFKKETTALKKMNSIKSSRLISGYQYSNFDLKVIKIKEAEWHKIIDMKISSLKYKYDKSMFKLNKEKFKYK